MILWALPCHYGGSWEATAATYGHQTGVGLPNNNKVHQKLSPSRKARITYLLGSPSISAGSSWWQVSPGWEGKELGECYQSCFSLSLEVVQALCVLWGMCLGRSQEVGGKEHAEEARGVFIDWARSTTQKESVLLLNFKCHRYKSRPSLSCNIQAVSPLPRTVSGHRGCSVLFCMQEWVNDWLKLWN